MHRTPAVRDHADATITARTDCRLRSATADQPEHLQIVDVVRDDLFTVLFQKKNVRYAVVALPKNEA
jgi:hypothetical protein